MIVLLNRQANNSRGLRKWEEIRGELEDRFLGRDYRVIFDARDLEENLRQETAAVGHTVIAAGGDGTVNFLVNQLMKLEERDRRQIVFGAIGLGSSNDFHKPFSDDRRLNGRVHVKLDKRRARAHNVGQVDFIDTEGKRRSKFFIINASVGIIAKANLLFNSGGRLINWLKPRCVLGAIYYAAIKTILTAQNIPAVVAVDGERCRTEITTLSILISPHFSGNLSYDLDVSPQSDYLGIALAERMGIGERLRALASLARSKFAGLPKTRIWRGRSVEIQTGSPVALETDGEVCLASDIRVRLLQGYMRVCQ
jgi:diacylglycerol kinase family enzyme